jgi:FlaA1/EpsC-like NDP-sugar epimerase
MQSDECGINPAHHPKFCIHHSELIISNMLSRNRFVLLADLLLIVVAALGSYALRLELTADFFRFYLSAGLWLAGTSLVVKPVVYALFGLYRRLWVYASVSELKLVVAAVTTASLAVSALNFVLFSLNVFGPGFSRSALAIDWLLSLVFVGGTRFTLRILAESNQARGQGKHKKILVIGAGSAGALVVKELQKNRQVNMGIVGFLDDDPAKQKHNLLGIPVIGKLPDLARALDARPIDEVIIAIPSAPGRVVRLVADVCRLKGVPFRTMPGIFELLGGKVSVSRLREVDITDLLRREPARLYDESIGATIAEKTVLVTGAGGSIGRELCRQIGRWNPGRLILLGHGENSIFETLLELGENFPNLDLHPLIADVRDAGRLEAIFNEYHPQVVFHTAAHKHVPLMEANPAEAVTNNVLGTRNMVETADRFGVERFVLISTDKAVAPSNVYGATKRLAEMLVLDAAERTGKLFTVVRFGNVLGSRGSIIPKFKHQIAAGGPLTITHPDMERFFMTIPEAVYLVLQASAFGRGGEVFVLNMGKQVRILDLAEDLIRLSGLEPGRDIEIVFTGIRPGEKLSEVLWDPGTPLEPTDHPDIFRLGNGRDDTSKLAEWVTRLAALAEANDSAGIAQSLEEIVPGAHLAGTMTDLMDVV